MPLLTATNCKETPPSEWLPCLQSQSFSPKTLNHSDWLIERATEEQDNLLLTMRNGKEEQNHRLKSSVFSIYVDGKETMFLN